MKTLYIALIALLFSSNIQAQFTSAKLQASGLTCALCTRAINKSLEQLSFIASITPDIKTSTFVLQFKPNTNVDIDAIRKGVEDAGFSVAKLQLTGNFPKVKLENDQHLELGGRQFHFLNAGQKQLGGEQTLTVVDKSFLLAKDFKKYSNASAMKCVQTGVAGDCCQKTGIKANTRIYHVTI